MTALKPNIGDLVEWTGDNEKYIWVGVITNTDISEGEENKFSIYWFKKPQGRGYSDRENRTTYHPDYQFGNLVLRLEKC